MVPFLSPLFCKAESSNLEFQAASIANSKKFTAIIQAPEFSEIRSWEHGHAYPGVAQGNLEWLVNPPYIDILKRAYI